MDQLVFTVARKLLRVAEEQPIAVLKLPGFHDCPLAGDYGVTNCPLGFDHRGVPTEVQPWMRGVSEDENWRDKWAEILAHCQRCQGKPEPSREQSGTLCKILDLLT